MIATGGTKTARRIPGVDKQFNSMTNQEKVAAKIKELQEAVTEVNGSVMVISVIDTDKKERCLMAGVTGYAAKLSEAITDQMTSKDETSVSKIIKKGFALAKLYKAMSDFETDLTEVETLVSNNQ